MAKPIHYMLARANHPEALAVEVEARLAEGWEIQGNVCIVKADYASHNIFYQTLVASGFRKYKEKKYAKR